MERQEFWKLIEDARTRAAGDTYAVSEHAVEILAALPGARIVAAAQPFWDRPPTPPRHLYLD
jgi:hypothetical protein